MEPALVRVVPRQPVKWLRAGILVLAVSRNARSLPHEPRMKLTRRSPPGSWLADTAKAPKTTRDRGGGWCEFGGCPESPLSNLIRSGWYRRLTRTRTANVGFRGKALRRPRSRNPSACEPNRDKTPSRRGFVPGSGVVVPVQRPKHHVGFHLIKSLVTVERSQRA